MSIPLSKQFVYNPYNDLQWGGRSMVPYFDIVKAAKVQGYDFTRANAIPVDNHVYDVETNAVVCRWDDLPDELPDPSQLLNFTFTTTADKTPEKSITERVVAYLADPDRSEPIAVLSSLTEAGFFKATDEAERLDVIETVLNEYEDTCPDGAYRARKALGLVPGDQTIRITLDIHMDDARVHRAFDVSDEVNDIAHEIATLIYEGYDTDGVAVVEANIKED
jgi:hypothetical protein